MSGAVFGRRALLKAAGSTLLVPAFLKSAFAEAELGPRLVLFMQPCGTHQPSFWPDPLTQSSPILAPLLDEPALAKKALLVRGIENRTKGFGNEHDRGFIGLWTGLDTIGTPEDAFGAGPSIDQQLKLVLRPKVAFPTLNCGVLAAEAPMKNGHRASFSYFGPSKQLPTQVDPVRLYMALFPSESGTPAQAMQRLLVRKSALDYAARDLGDLSLRLGAEQRQKLDAHATAIREYEERMEAALRAGQCARPDLPVGVDPRREDDVPLLTNLMLELLAVALGCNLTRIVTFQLGHCGSSWRYRWLGLNEDSHEVAHRDTLDGANIEAAEKMTRISRWVAEQVASFARRLDALPDRTGTVLDHSLMVWANENGTGFHGLSNVPVVLLGRAGGRLSRTGLVDEGVQGHHQLGTTVLRLMGVDASGFGDQPQAGPLRGVS